MGVSTLKADHRATLAEALLAQIPDRAKTAVALNRALPGYDALSEEALRGETEAIGRFAVNAVFVADQPPSPQQVRADIEPVARARAAMGVPVDSMLRGIQLGAEELWGLIVSTVD